MNVIYVGQLYLDGEFMAMCLVNFPKFDEFLPHFYKVKFCAEESSKQKDSKISRTGQKPNTEIGVRPLYLSPNFTLI